MGFAEEMENKKCKCGHEFREHVAAHPKTGGFGCRGNDDSCDCKAFEPT